MIFDEQTQSFEFTPGEQRCLGELHFVRATFYRLAAESGWWSAMMQVLDCMWAKNARDGQNYSGAVLGDSLRHFDPREPHHRVPRQFFEHALRDLASQSVKH